ncbi:UNVERIFIED_CONTAM: hypothetical protein HDU68_002456, partial [Siphonaria sp. JEL0065]
MKSQKAQKGICLKGLPCITLQNLYTLANNSMLVSVLAGVIAGALTVVQAAPTPRAQNNKIVGYVDSWYWYSHGSQPPKFTDQMIKSYTHVNFAFATIAYHQATDSYFIDFTDAFADYQSLPGGYPTSECIPVPVNKQCGGATGKVAMVPYIGYNGTCPDTSCYNPSHAAGSPRNPACEAVLSQWTTMTYNGDAQTPALCGHYGYFLNHVKKAQNPSFKYMLSIGGWYDSNLFSAATEPKYIDKFITSVVEFVKFFGIDGVDFDWEYPGWEHGDSAPFPGQTAMKGTQDDVQDCSVATCSYAGRTNDKAKFNALATKLRAALTAAGKTAAGGDYQMSMAAPAGLAKMNKLDIKTICATLDFINIM